MFYFPRRRPQESTLSTSLANASKTWRSWNDLVQHPYDDLHVIAHEHQIGHVLQGAVAARPFGHRYSTSDISAGQPTLLDMTSYDDILNIDHDRMEITAQAGITLKKLLSKIDDLGWALPCLPDIDAITLGGALATGTHGTGRDGHILSHYMTRCRLVRADGEVLDIKEGDPRMPAVRVSLGVLGVFSEITMRCVPHYRLHLREGPMRDHLWLDSLERLHDTYDFLRILWLPHTDRGYVITGNKIAEDVHVEEHTGPFWLKHRRKASKWLYSQSWRVPATTHIANNLLYYGFFQYRKEHAGSLYQATVTKKRSSTMKLAEWTIPRRLFPTVFMELKRAFHDHGHDAYAHIPMDVRFLKRDEHWLSYAYGEDCVTMGCVCRDAPHADHYAAFGTMERVFLRHGGRPHWAKHFEATGDTIASLYPKFEDFAALRQQLDPTNKLLNSYLAKMF